VYPNLDLFSTFGLQVLLSNNIRQRKHRNGPWLLQPAFTTSSLLIRKANLSLCQNTKAKSSSLSTQPPNVASRPNMKASKGFTRASKKNTAMISSSSAFPATNSVAKNQELMMTFRAFARLITVLLSQFSERRM